MSNISINDLLKKDKPTIIDIRNKVSYNNGHINNAINIPYEELMNNYRNYLRKGDKYYIYCKSGKLSKRVVAVLSYLGYNVNIINTD